MKRFIQLFAFLLVVACAGADPPREKEGYCPAVRPGFGVCVFKSSLNCVRDSDCEGAKICCPEACNKICKDPVLLDHEEDPTEEIIQRCPPNTEPDVGACIFNRDLHCLSDNECGNERLCCPEGCHRVCKVPVVFQPFTIRKKKLLARI